MRTVIAIVVALVIVAGGAYALVKHNDNKSNSGSNGYSYNSSSSQTASGNSQSPAVNNAVVITKTDSKVGSYLAEPDGTALYTYTQDSNGVSNCTGSCLAAWPAYSDSGATTGLPANIGTIKRSDDGKIQFTYKGLPLYTFVSDGKGQVTGNGVSGFQVAKP